MVIDDIEKHRCDVLFAVIHEEKIGIMLSNIGLQMSMHQISKSFFVKYLVSCGDRFFFEFYFDVVGNISFLSVGEGICFLESWHIHKRSIPIFELRWGDIFPRNTQSRCLRGWCNVSY